MSIVLASGSPRRKELLEMLGIEDMTRELVKAYVKRNNFSEFLFCTNRIRIIRCYSIMVNIKW